MKRIGRFFLLLCLVFPSITTSSFANARPDTCVLCGHTCCCPERCQAELARMKNARHASEAADASCGRAVCRIVPAGDADADYSAGAVSQKPRIAITARDLAPPAAPWRRLPPVAPAVVRFPDVAVPTPPPRRIA